MTWQKGVSGNPNGGNRRSITRVLRNVMAHTVEVGGGDEVAADEVLAGYIRKMLLFAKVELVNGDTIDLTSEQWLRLIDWYFTRMDGAPRGEGDASQQAQTILVLPEKIITDDDAILAEAARRATNFLPAE